ncbi:unnamed protein product [Porites evermanni]|uniref:Uncharacterized protein n=1 Tax=Porites evermanni TaxID=104178 RepID=A0ABN8MNF3_9CNID|nr:unnamed protein product [Porites evermanni]
MMTFQGFAKEEIGDAMETCFGKGTPPPPGPSQKNIDGERRCSHLASAGGTFFTMHMSIKNAEMIYGFNFGNVFWIRYDMETSKKRTTQERFRELDLVRQGHLQEREISRLQ